MVKNFYIKLLIFLFLFIGFFCTPINQTLAALEVQYPTLPTMAGSSSTAGSGNVSDLPSYVKYLFSAGVSIGFIIALISLVIAGTMYFLAPISAELKRDAKDRAMGAISGLLILLLTYLVITTINPQLNVFTINNLPPASVATPSTPPKDPGVYFYTDASCPDNTAKATTSSVSDFGPLRKKISSVDIVPDTANGHAYISLLYENPNFWGKCQYISSNGCKPVGQWAISASVYQYDFNSNGTGVYFFREPCFNDKPYYNDVNGLIDHCTNESGSIKEQDSGAPKSMGGYYKVEGSDIKNIYVGKLDDLKFLGVPDGNQNCTKYDKKGKCSSRQPPSLGGENISSIIINGNYLVLLVYVGQGDSPDGPWTSCEEFPTIGDANRSGPRQIEWDTIRNSGGLVPNYVIIIPVTTLNSKPSTTTPTLLPIPAQ